MAYAGEDVVTNEQATAEEFNWLLHRAALGSVTDDLSDLTETSWTQTCAASTTYTVLNVASGGCRLIGGLINLVRNSTDFEIYVTVDGGAAQTLTPSGMLAGNSFVLLPPIRCTTSLLVQVRNIDPVNAWGADAKLWHSTM